VFQAFQPWPRLRHLAEAAIGPEVFQVFRAFQLWPLKQVKRLKHLRLYCGLYYGVVVLRSGATGHAAGTSEAQVSRTQIATEDVRGRDTVAVGLAPLLPCRIQLLGFNVVLGTPLAFVAYERRDR
jgi:hypothetical protein